MIQHFPGAMIDGGAGPGGPDRRGRMMLIAAPPDRIPAVSFGSALFQRIRIVFMDEDELDGLAPSHIVGELPQLRASAAVEAPAAAQALRHSRRLQGEILCDASGRLYERTGHYVQPVHHLVAGPHGEVLDLAPPAPRAPRQVPRADPVIDVVEEDGAFVCDEPHVPPAALPWTEIATPALAKPRVVRFGDFKHVLGPQMLHPERLRETHRLACRVRVYEAARAQRLDALVSDVFDGGSGVLLPLTDSLAARLDLAEWLQRRRTPGPPNREPGHVLAGERLVRLSPIDDPTAALPEPRHETRPSAEAAQAASPPPIQPAAPPADRTAKTAIPERFVGPWPFVISRDEAVYDLNADRTRPRLQVLLDRLRGGAVSGGDLRKWQALLHGKSLDDQLWAVRPPRGGLRDSVVQQWARRTLEAAGYDAGAMLLEWEIFWRRKGL